MHQENAIEVRNVTKVFRIYKDKGNSLKDKVLFRERNKYETRTVLKDVSFEIKKGEAVGLIGHNGCGKSTTLKLLTQIIYPDSGSIKVQGRVSSLLELGAGFHPDMSGRDNIYTNASIFGLTRKEIDERVDDIIEFSELGYYIDSPVRTYSSGMYMRLAFSVAINVNADILLIDEILAVGDLNFQEKCIKKLQKIKDQGTTIVIVSHSMGQIESICDRAIWLNDGEIVEDNVPGYVHRKYLEFIGDYSFADSVMQDASEVDEQGEETSEEGRLRFERRGSGEVRIKNVCCKDDKGVEQTVFATGDNIWITMDLEVNCSMEINMRVGILRTDYMLCYETEFKEENKGYLEVKEDGEFYIKFSNVSLLPSKYMVDIRIVTKDGRDLDIYNEATEFYIYSPTEEKGMVRMEHEWISETPFK